MNLLAKYALTAGLIVCAAGAPALADVAASVQSKIDVAMKAAKSYVVTTQYPAQSYASTLVYVAPDRYRLAVAVSATTTDLISVGSVAYRSKNGAAFEKAPLSTEDSTAVQQIAHVKVSAPREDVTVGGVTYGAFDAPPPPGLDAALTCTYDKKSFRLVRCANADWTQTFAGYDDPKNVVEPPAGVK